MKMTKEIFQRAKAVWSSELTADKRENAQPQRFISVHLWYLSSSFYLNFVWMHTHFDNGNAMF